MYKTYAVYEEKQSFNVLKGKIGDFSSKKGDLQLAMFVNDVKAKKVPAKGNLYNVEVDCETANSGVSGTWDYTNWTVLLSSLADKDTPVVCNIRFNPVYKIYMGDSTEKVSDFPTKPTEQAKDYSVETTCDKGAATFDKTTWKFNVTTYVEGMSCDVRFKPMYNITLNGSSVDLFPTKPTEQANDYAVETTCTNGTAVWDKTNWKVNVTNGTNTAMKCDIKFTKMYNITVEGNKSDTFPTKEVATEKSYATRINCTNGTAEWDKTNWNVKITDGNNPVMKCDIDFYVYHEPTYNIIVLGETAQDFPTKPTEQASDYAVTVSNCVNGSATWDKANWRINITNDEGGMSCDVKFERMYTITIAGASSTTFPTSQLATSTGYRYDVTTNCTNGTGSWDATNWRMTENSNTNSTMKCAVSFVKSQLECQNVEYKSYSGCFNAYSNGGWISDACYVGPCNGSAERICNSYYRVWWNGTGFASQTYDGAKNKCLKRVYG